MHNQTTEWIFYKNSRSISGHILARRGYIRNKRESQDLFTNMKKKKYILATYDSH
jgi:hypothetical protein